MKPRALAPVVVALLLVTLFGEAHGEVVRVGGYPYEPFVREIGPGRHAGLTIELIHLLNAEQEFLEFEFVPTSPRRRWADFLAGRFDAVFFEQPEWGWQDLHTDASPTIFLDKQVFIAPALSGRGQEYFADLTQRSKLGVLGYHYEFAGNVTDPRVLRRTHDLVLTPGYESVLSGVLGGRADIGVMTTAYLEQRFAEDPSLEGRLLVSDRVDAVFHLAVIASSEQSSSGPLAIDLLENLLATGRLFDLYRRIGVHGQESHLSAWETEQAE